MKAKPVSHRERPYPFRGPRAEVPQVVRLELTIVFQPQGEGPARVISCEVTRADL